LDDRVFHFSPFTVCFNITAKVRRIVMRDVSACVGKPGTVVLIVAACLLGSVASSDAVGGVPKITLQARDAVETVVNYTHPGATITVDAVIALPVIEADDPPPIAVDVYVGILGPDGQSAASWTGSAQAPVLVKGPPVPFLPNVVPQASVSYRLVVPDIAAGEAPGWYVLYGLVVVAGSDPKDPKHWLSSSFVPLLLVGSAPQIDFYTIGVTVVNDSPNCAWITPYWANTLTPWHIFDSADTRPRFVEAGKSYKFAYLVIVKALLAPAVQIRVRAEVQRGPGCNSGTGVDVEGVNKDLNPREGILDACAHLKFEGGRFFVTQPTQTADCR
jgi:hypothetical protein